MPSRVEGPEPPTGASHGARAPADGPLQAAPRRRPRHRLPLDPLPEPRPKPPDPPTPGFAGDGAVDPWGAAALEVERRPGRSPRPETCPFLRAAGADAAIGPPVDAVAAGNRCTALGPPQALSEPQQRLVCLAASHAACPRYLQGVAAAEDGLLGRTSRRGPPLSIAAAFAVLALTAVAVAAYMVASGGLALALPPASPSGDLLAGAERTQSATPTAAALGATATPSAAPAPTPTPSDIPIPTAPPSPSPTPSPTPRPTTVADRFRGLDRCDGPEVCYMYVVRSGDNLSSISSYFGSTLAAVLEMNPQIEDPSSIRPGDRINLPPP